MGSLSGSGGSPWPQSAGGGGGGTIDFAKVNRDGTKERRNERTTDAVIPAGWSSLSIYNSSITTDILLNGEPLHANAEFNSGNIIDWAALKQEFGGQITIVSNGQLYAFHVIYPTSSAVDVNTI